MVFGFCFEFLSLLVKGINIQKDFIISFKNLDFSFNVIIFYFLVVYKRGF